MTELNLPDLKAIVADVVHALAVRARVDIAKIDEQTDLFAAGIVDSFGFFDLIEEVEARTGKHIDLSMLDDSDIGTIAGIARQFAR